jgi:RNA polymerase sigma-70 factor (ECF subfamily)
MPQSEDDVTGLLLIWSEGNRTALDRLMPLVYQELRRLAHRELRRESPGGPIATTALVHEAYLRLVDQQRARAGTRAHFLSLAAQMMRRVLIDAARKRKTVKRGAGAREISFEDVAEPVVEPDARLLALDDALMRLAEFDAGLSRLVELRYFGGLSLEEAAEILGTSTTSAWRDWNTARAWLYDDLRNR